jgi:hypothetical protein
MDHFCESEAPVALFAVSAGVLGQEQVLLVAILIPQLQILEII